MGRQVPLLISGARELRCARLTCHSYLWQVGPPGRSPGHCPSEPCLYEFQVLRRDDHLADDLRLEGADQPPIGGPHLIDDLGPIEGSSVGHRSRGVHHLQRSGQDEALTDGDVVGVASGPGLGVVDALPLSRGHQARRLPGESDL